MFSFNSQIKKKKAVKSVKGTVTSAEYGNLLNYKICVVAMTLVKQSSF